MSLNEWLLFVGVILLLFFVSQFVRKRIKRQTRLILSLVWFLAFITWFIVIGASEHFTRWQLGVLIAFVVAWLISFYLQYRKYRKESEARNY